MATNLPLTTSSTSRLATSADRALVADTLQVVKRLCVMFPQLAEKNAGSMPLLVNEWGQGLADMRPQEIARGLAACRTRKFAPSLGEFAQLCRPSLDPEVAFMEAEVGLRARERGEQGTWSHPAIWRAGRAMRSLVLEGNYGACRKRWEFTLAAEMDAGWGEDVPPVPKRLAFNPSQEQKPIPAEIRRRIAGILGKNRKNNGTDS